MFYFVHGLACFLFALLVRPTCRYRWGALLLMGLGVLVGIGAMLVSLQIVYGGGFGSWDACLELLCSGLCCFAILCLVFSFMRALMNVINKRPWFKVDLALCLFVIFIIFSALF